MIRRGKNPEKIKEVILVLASGRNKAKALEEMVEGTVSPKNPATILQSHKDCTLIIDRDAAYRLHL